MDIAPSVTTVRLRFLVQAVVFTTLGLVLGLTAPVKRPASQGAQPVAASIEFAPVGLAHPLQQVERWVF